MIIILALNYYLSGEDLKSRQKALFDEKLDQIVQMLEINEEEVETQQNNLKEDYLSRAREFAFIIEQNPSILKERSQLLRVKELLGVDELHVADEYGILIYSTVPGYVGLDFHDGAEMREFLHLLESADADAFLIQEAQHNTAEEKNMLYIGVKRLDREGILQIGIAPERLSAVQEKNSTSYIFDRIPTDIGESLFAVDKESGVFIGHTKASKTGVSLEDTDNSYEDLENCFAGGFLEMEQIRNGALETTVSIEDNQELADLSKGINAMVEGILSTTVKLSRVVELTGMPMAVFECRNGVKKVMATARLAEILDMDMLDIKILLADSRMFGERLEEIQRNPVDGEKDVYQLDNDRYIKLRMSGDESGSFGIVMDVTDEIREKLHIRYVHDHDPLTGMILGIPI